MSEKTAEQIAAEEKAAKEQNNKATPAPAPVSKLEMTEGKLKTARKELTALRKEVKELTVSKETSDQKAELYFQKYTAEAKELSTLRGKMRSSLDMVGDAMNMSIKQLRQAFGTLQGE